MTSPRSHERPGVALVWAVIVLAVLAGLLGAIAVQITSGRRTQHLRERQVQATWLARSGVEVAVQKWLADPNGFKDHVLAIVPHSEVRIAVAKDKDEITITSEARYPTDESMPAVRQERRSFRAVGEGNQIRLEPIPTRE
ncbi:MAG: hypothetical protein HY040_01355 [Planctomycetes bacterium]|nr:hypothetical protein [Planctomycetota bacterium]